jgi:hypothetical protein
MREAFPFRLSPEPAAAGNDRETIDCKFHIGDGTADFGWICTRNKAETYWPRRYEAISNGSSDRMVLSGVETKDQAFDVPPG